MAPARRTLSAALGLAALALAACAKAPRPETVPGAAAPGVTAPATATATVPPATGASSSTTPSTSPPPPPSAPASYVEFFRSGLGTLVPSGWTKDQQPADHTDFRDPSGELLLRLSGTFVGKSPTAYLKGLSDQASKTYPQYRLIRLGELVTGRGSYPYAEWEFTFVKDGVTRHVVEAALAGSAAGKETLGQVYYSAPVSYFAETQSAYQHALDGVFFAG